MKCRLAAQTVLTGLLFLVATPIRGSGDQSHKPRDEGLGWASRQGSGDAHGGVCTGRLVQQAQA